MKSVVSRCGVACGALSVVSMSWIDATVPDCERRSYALASTNVGEPFPALTIYYNAAKFVAQELTPQVRAMVKRKTAVRSTPFEFMPSKFRVKSVGGDLQK